jgi:hypothetical protein
MVLGAVCIYAAALLGVALRGDDCAYHDIFGAADVGIIRSELSWWPPGWNCSAERHGGGMIRLDEAWTPNDVIAFILAASVVAGLYGLLRWRRGKRRADA